MKHGSMTYLLLHQCTVVDYSTLMHPPHDIMSTSDVVHTLYRGVPRTQINTGRHMVYTEYIPMARMKIQLNTK